MFDMMLAITANLSISPDGIHVAFVHYSSPGSRTAALFTLDIGTNYTDVYQRVKQINIPDIMGASDLDM
jgi:hypothetical protein